MPTRRTLIGKGAHACAAAVAAGAAPLAAQSEGGKQNYLLLGLCGSENPTRANFPFVWAAALRDAGNEVRLELAGDAVVLIRHAVAGSVTPVGWPPFSQALAKVIELKIPIFV